MRLFSKIKNIYTGLFVMLAAMATTSCQTGLEYDDVPESYYTDVNLSSCWVSSRALFEDCLFAKNYNGGKGEITSAIRQVDFAEDATQWTNNTGSDYTLEDGTVVAPGQKVNIPLGLYAMTTRDDASAPEGKVYVLTYYIPSTVTYETPNKGYLFIGSKMPQGYTLVNPTDGMSTQATKPVDTKQLVVTMLASQYNGDATTFTPLNGAPALGVPGDFSVPRQYLVKNNMRRPKGVAQSQRIYEVHVVVLPA